MQRTRMTWLVTVAALLVAGTAAAQVFLPGGALAERLAARRQALVTELALSPAQAEALVQVERRRADFLFDLRVDIAALRAELHANLQAPDADLRAMVRTVQDTVDRQIAAHRAVTEARLDFYERLDPGQQARVRAELRARLERLERLGAALGELALLAQ